MKITPTQFGNVTSFESTSAHPARSPDGPYRPELAAAFREGARILLDNIGAGERVSVLKDALIEEDEGGVIVHCLIFVSDAERPLMKGETQD